MKYEQIEKYETVLNELNNKYEELNKETDYDFRHEIKKVYDVIKQMYFNEVRGSVTSNNSNINSTYDMERYLNYYTHFHKTLEQDSKDYLAGIMDGLHFETYME